MFDQERKPWSSHEMVMLSEMFREKMSIHVMALRLGRTEKAIIRRIYDMNLNGRRVLTWTIEQTKTARRMHEDGASMQDIASAVGKTSSAVQTKLARMGLRARNGDAKPSKFLGEPEPIKPTPPQDHREANMLHLVDVMRAFGALTVGELREAYCKAHELDVPPAYDGHRVTRIFTADTRSCVGSTMAMCAEVA